MRKSDMSEVEKLCEEAMRDKAVTTLSGWTDACANDICDDDNEEEYRKRLSQNADILHKKIKSVFE